MTKIKDSVFLLTGASSGIGEAIAYALAAQNAKVILAARREEELQRVKGNCKNHENVKVLTLDLSKSEFINKKAQEAEDFFGHVDVLINCGGISQRDKAINTKIDVDRRLMEVNYFGTVALSKALLPKMINRQSGHHVIITSATGIISTPLRSSSAASKHALHGFYDALRAEVFEDNIKVTMVLPGYIRTKISYNALVGDGSKQNSMDQAQENGLSPESCAKGIIKAIVKNKEEVYIGGIKEVAGIYIKRFFPGIFSRIVRKTAVT